MKKLLLLVMCGLILSPSALSVNNAKVNKELRKAPNTKEVLRVFNVEEYMDETLDEDFEKYYLEKYGKEVDVIYTTFATNEEMLNILRTGKTQYDLVCPSDYAIQKMLIEDMIIKFDMDEEKQNYTYIDNYNKYASPYIKTIFNENKYNDVSWTEYAVPYMWGTLGLIYNTERVDREDMTSWYSLWNKKYSEKFTIKNSVRDTYFIGVINAYKDEIKAVHDQYAIDGDVKKYNSELTKIFNYANDESIERVEKSLIELKDNAFGLEVDSGKQDVSSGKIDINFAWSGDAVYAIELAEEANISLEYIIPYEGSNVWFDGWVMPKGANTELAQIFLDYICSPENVIRNMDYIGYTSAIGGEEVFNYINEGYSSDSEDAIPYDLSYFFDGTLPEGQEAVVYIDQDTRYIISAQYPTLAEINRCGIMKDFGSQNNAVLDMWSRIKVIPVPIYVYVISLVVVIAVVSLYVGYKVYKTSIRKKRMNKYRK